MSDSRRRGTNCRCASSPTRRRPKRGGGRRGRAVEAAAGVVRDKRPSSPRWRVIVASTRERSSRSARSPRTRATASACGAWARRLWAGHAAVRTGPGPPDAPPPPTAGEIGATSILVLWGQPARDNGMPVTEFVAQLKRFGRGTARDDRRPGVSVRDDSADFRDVYRGAERAFIAGELAQSTIYVFRVAAVSRIGVGPWSAGAAFRTASGSADDGAGGARRQRAERLDRVPRRRHGRRRPVAARPARRRARDAGRGRRRRRRPGGARPTCRAGLVPPAL